MYKLPFILTLRAPVPIEEHLQAVPSLWVKYLPGDSFCGLYKGLGPGDFDNEVTAFNCVVSSFQALMEGNEKVEM